LAYPPVNCTIDELMEGCVNGVKQLWQCRIAGVRAHSRYAAVLDVGRTTRATTERVVAGKTISIFGTRRTTGEPRASPRQRRVEWLCTGAPRRRARLAALPPRSWEISTLPVSRTWGACWRRPWCFE
ncbi:unnamed protein product, partial [Ectocarpus fasciculatus]